MVGPSDGRNLPGDVDARDRVEEIDLVRRTAPAASFTDRRPVLRLAYEAHRPRACGKDGGRFTHGGAVLHESAR
jgi:hypothetical protein